MTGPEIPLGRHKIQCTVELDLAQYTHAPWEAVEGNWGVGGLM